MTGGLIHRASLARSIPAVLLFIAAASCAPTTPHPVSRPARPAGSRAHAAPPPSSPEPAPGSAAAPASPTAAGASGTAGKVPSAATRQALRIEPVGEAVPVAPILLKVGVASDLPAVSLPCCEAGLRLSVGGKVVAAVSSIRVEPAAAGAQAGIYRLQVAALRDERQAQDLARRLERDTGQPGDAHFDAGIDLYRVRIGRYTTREAADSDLRRLSTIGVTGAFVVYEGGGAA